ncbi:MAG: sodium-dependent transporter [Candidatus Abyssobacteria bacterium SURF_5]|uniref:Transporter n=1 Tax=Abyssobacteria bacterium (strain SURF_5) TaxID=2093360 RepID=A0A3A4NEF1_ABYX5|nr:MAG: sodium-dependent transporter [Candidatus Abyssubacteria bacterium SURF_5]
MTTERWSSRTTFVLAAVGSAVGLGNLWRFPYVVYDSGGAVFLIPWLIALLTAGLPLLILEMAVGCWGRDHWDVSGAPSSFGKLHPGWSWIGWGTLANAFIIVCYYAIVMAWAYVYLAKSFRLGWGNDAEAYFFKDVLRLSSGPGSLGGIVPVVMLGALIAWLSIYFAIFKGTKLVGKIVMWTVPLPIMLIIIFIIRGLTLPGSFEGLAFYLRPEWGKLLEPNVWLSAYSQVFFSLTLAFGVMPVYASYLPKNSDINANALWVTALDAAISFTAGFAVFTVLGFLAMQKGVSVSEVVASGPGLAFVTYPTAISLMPFMANLFGVLFFLMLLTLAIDSAFSLVEGVVAGFRDFLPWRHETMSFIACFIALVGGWLYMTQAGLYWLDVVDRYINYFGLTLFGLFECIAIGWLFGADKMRRYINSVSQVAIGRWWDVCIKFITPAALLTIIVSVLIESLRAPYENYPQWVLLIGGWGAVAFSLGAGIFFSRIFRRRLETAHREESLAESESSLP